MRLTFFTLPQYAHFTLKCLAAFLCPLARPTKLLQKGTHDVAVGLPPTLRQLSDEVHTLLAFLPSNGLVKRLPPDEFLGEPESEVVGVVLGHHGA